jgi:hypothetical protein
MGATCLSRDKGPRRDVDYPTISRAGVKKIKVEVNFILKQALYAQRGA